METNQESRKIIFAHRNGSKQIVAEGFEAYVLADIKERPRDARETRLDRFKIKTEPFYSMPGNALRNLLREHKLTCIERRIQFSEDFYIESSLVDVISSENAMIASKPDIKKESFSESESLNEAKPLGDSNKMRLEDKSSSELVMTDTSASLNPNIQSSASLVDSPNSNRKQKASLNNDNREEVHSVNKMAFFSNTGLNSQTSATNSANQKTYLENLLANCPDSIESWVDNGAFSSFEQVNEANHFSSKSQFDQLLSDESELSDFDDDCAEAIREALSQ